MHSQVYLQSVRCTQVHLQRYFTANSFNNIFFVQTTISNGLTVKYYQRKNICKSYDYLMGGEGNQQN